MIQQLHPRLVQASCSVHTMEHKTRAALQSKQNYIIHISQHNHKASMYGVCLLSSSYGQNQSLLPPCLLGKFYLLHLQIIFFFLEKEKRTLRNIMPAPFFPDLKTMSWRLSATTTLTGSSFFSGMGSDFLYGDTFPSCKCVFQSIGLNAKELKLENLI